MTWHTTVSSEFSIIEVCYAGEIDQGQLVASAEEVLELLETHARCRVLSDCTAMEGGYTRLDLFRLAEMIQQKCKIRKLKNAIISTGIGNKAENTEFWETTCEFREIRVFVCNNRQDAIEWLRQ